MGDHRTWRSGTDECERVRRMPCIGRLCVASLLVLLLLAAGFPAAGQQVRLSNVPLPVLEAVRTRFKGARLNGAEKGVQEGTAVYEIAIKDRGQSIDVILTPQGAILLIKKHITVEGLPETVTRALELSYPQATYQEVEEVITVQGPQETLAHYEVKLVTAQRRTMEVQVSPDGKITPGVR
jgi:hypothetical protein